MGFFSSKTVLVERPVYSRISQMMQELYYFRHGEYPIRADLERMTDGAITQILDDFVESHFGGAARSAAKTFARQMDIFVDEEPADPRQRRMRM